MGVLTDDMARLRGEIDAMRDAREVLNQELARDAQGRRSSVAAMLVRMHQAHAEMGRTTGTALRAFRSGLATDMGKMRADFRTAHDQMARTARADRARFVAGNRRAVNGTRREFAAELAGARRAWLGRGA